METNLKNNRIQQFDGKPVRTFWDEKNSKWYFCIFDVVSCLSNVKDKKDYIKKLRKRNVQLGLDWTQIAKPIPFPTSGGVQKINFADKDGIMRIAKHISSQKIEIFFEWMQKLQIEEPI